MENESFKKPKQRGNEPWTDNGEVKKEETRKFEQAIQAFHIRNKLVLSKCPLPHSAVLALSERRDVSRREPCQQSADAGN